jgi:chromosome segregation ATPase
MRDEVSRLESQIDRMREEYSRDLEVYRKLKEDEITSLREALKSLEGNNEEVVHLKGLLQALREKEEEIVYLRNICQTNEAKEQEIRDLRLALKKAQVQLFELDELRERLQLVTHKTDEVERLRYEILESDKKIVQLEHDLNDHRMRAEASAIEIQKLREMHTLKQSELIKCQNEFERKTEELIQTKNEIFTRNVEITRLRESAEAIRYKDEEIARLNDTLRSSLEALKTAELNLSSQTIHSNSRIATEADSTVQASLFIEQIRSLYTQLEAANAKNDKLHDLLLYNIRTLEDAHMAAMKDYLQHIENLATKNDHFCNDMVEYTKELEESRFRVRTLEHENASLNKEIQHLKKRLAKREALINKALQRLENIHQLQQESCGNESTIYHQLQSVENMIRTNGILNGEVSKRDPNARVSDPSSTLHWRSEALRSSADN